MKKARYIRLIDGRYHWIPSPKMRAAGFSQEPLGADLEKANVRANYLNAQWDAEKVKIAKEPLQTVTNGTFNWLFGEFQKDPVWYKSKSIRTQDGIDRAFRRIGTILGETNVRSFSSRHARGLYNRLHKEGGVNVARDSMKWFRRAMRYAKEIGVRDDNPVSELTMEEPPPRKAVWAPEEVEAVIGAALAGGKAKSGNEIPPRPSIALATAIAYDVGQQKCDVLSLTWDQWDGTAFVVVQQKKRGDRRLYLPVTEETRQMIEASARKSTYVIVDELTGTPFVDEPGTSKRSRTTAFARAFKKTRIRAGITRDIWFADLRRTALTELGNSGATDTEIVSISGHSHGSPILKRYVIADKAAALAAAEKRVSAQKGRQK